MLKFPKSCSDRRLVTERESARRNDLTASRLRDLLEYDPLAGEFRWKVWRSGTAHVGSIAGVLDRSRGYRKISIDGIAHPAHRLAWLHVYGEWPSGLIDHINGVRDDNRIANLRDATRQDNSANSRHYRNNCETERTRG